MRRLPTPYSHPQKRENPFAIFGYILGATAMFVVVIAALYGLLIGILQFVQGGLALLILFLIVAALITVITTKLRRWVTPK